MRKLTPCFSATSSAANRAAIETNDASAPFHLAQQCSQTYCAWSTAVRDEANRTCRDTCADMPIPNCGSCSDEDYVCEDWEKTTCYEHEFEPSKPLIPDAAVEAACNRFFDHLDACKLRVTGFVRTDCVKVAKTEAAPYATYLDCHTALDCNDDGASCVLATSTLGDEIASAYRGKCADAQSTEEQRATYNDVGAGRTAALVAAAKACVTDNACDVISSCLAAWWELG